MLLNAHVYKHMHTCAHMKELNSTPNPSAQQA